MTYLEKYMKHKLLLIILLFSLTSLAWSQSQVEAGAELAASFPDLAQGSNVYDLPEDGQWWDRNDSGWGFAWECQSRYNSPSGYFCFVTLYTYDDAGNGVWYAGGANYEPSEPYQWRDHKNFSNMPWGHNNSPVLADYTIPVHRMKNGSALGVPDTGDAEIEESIDVRFKFTSPTSAVIYPEGGQSHEVSRFAWRDDSVNPTLDWIKDYSWHVISSTGIYGFLQNGPNIKHVYNTNASMEFVDLDVTDQPDLKDFIGHQNHYEYYISTIKVSYKSVLFFDQEYLAEPFMPYTQGGSSNRQYLVLVHDPVRNQMSLYTVAGEPEPDSLRPDAGISIKYRANINPDADVIDFYPLLCEGESQGCPSQYYEHSLYPNATFSEQNVHRSTLKMFKIRTGDKAYMFQPNTGESDSSATTRITNRMLDEIL